MLQLASNSTQSVISTLSNWMSFTDNSLEQLERVEARIFENFEVEYTTKYVPVRFKKSDIFTVVLNPKKEYSTNEAVVFMPGFGAGIAMWCSNMKEISKIRQVYGFDLLGFGRSSRPTFSSECAIAELEMVEAIEDWRKEMGIEKMYIVGHSIGGYLASAYALEHPSRVSHLVLVDPWGFAEKVDANEKLIKPYPWMTFLGGVAGCVNPLSPMRWMGPFAPAIVSKLRPDLQLRFKSSRPGDIYKYIYLCNLPNPTGETAFMNMTLPVGWAKRPMIKRFNGIDKNVGVTFIYGSKSWMDPGPAMDIQQIKNRYVDIKIIRGAGHHVYVDEPEAFNEILIDVIEGRFEEPTNNDFEDYGCCH